MEHSHSSGSHLTETHRRYDQTQERSDQEAYPAHAQHRRQSYSSDKNNPVKSKWKSKSRGRGFKGSHFAYSARPPPEPYNQPPPPPQHVQYNHVPHFLPHGTTYLPPHMYNRPVHHASLAWTEAEYVQAFNRDVHNQRVATIHTSILAGPPMRLFAPVAGHDALTNLEGLISGMDFSLRAYYNQTRTAIIGEQVSRIEVMRDMLQLIRDGRAYQRIEYSDRGFMPGWTKKQTGTVFPTVYVSSNGNQPEMQPVHEQQSRSNVNSSTSYITNPYTADSLSPQQHILDVESPPTSPRTTMSADDEKEFPPLPLWKTKTARGDTALAKSPIITEASAANANRIVDGDEVGSHIEEHDFVNCLWDKGVETSQLPTPENCSPPATSVMDTEPSGSLCNNIPPLTKSPEETHTSPSLGKQIITTYSTESDFYQQAMMTQEMAAAGKVGRNERGKFEKGG